MVDSSFPGCYINAKISVCSLNRDLLEIMQKVSFSAQLFSICLIKMWDRFAKTKLWIRMKYLIYQKLWCFHPWSRAKFNSLQNGKSPTYLKFCLQFFLRKLKLTVAPTGGWTSASWLRTVKRQAQTAFSYQAGIHPGKMHSIWGWEGRGGFWIPRILFRSTSHNWECQNWNMKSKQNLKTPWKGECPIFGGSKNLS